MTTENAFSPKNEEQPIEGGEVGELTDLRFHEGKHRAETARSLAMWLVVILGVSLALHYPLSSVLGFSDKKEAIKNLNSIFHASLTAISCPVRAADTDNVTPR